MEWGSLGLSQLSQIWNADGARFARNAKVSFVGFPKAEGQKQLFMSQQRYPKNVIFLLKLFFPLLQNNTKITTLPTLCNYGKTRLFLFKL